MIRRCLARSLCLPTYNERENIGGHDRRARRRARHRPRSRPRHRRRLSGRNRRDRRPARRRAPVGLRASPRDEGGNRAGVRRRVPAAPLDEAPSSCSRWTATSPHNPADVPRLIAAADDADLVLGSRYAPGRRDGELGSPSAGSCRVAAASTRRSSCGMRVRDLTGGFKCFRRATLESDRPRRPLRPRLRVPDRDDRTASARRASGSRRCRSRSWSAARARRR